MEDKQRREKAAGNTGPGSRRQGQKPGAQQNQRRKSNGDGLGGAQPDPALFHSQF